MCLFFGRLGFLQYRTCVVFFLKTRMTIKITNWSFCFTQGKVISLHQFNQTKFGFFNILFWQIGISSLHSIALVALTTVYFPSSYRFLYAYSLLFVGNAADFAIIFAFVSPSLFGNECKETQWTRLSANCYFMSIQREIHKESVDLGWNGGGGESVHARWRYIIPSQ